MIPTLSNVCSLASSLENDVAEYAAGKCDSLDLWLTKLEEYLRSHSLAEARKLFADHGMNVPVASYQGGLLTTQGERRREAWDLFRKRLELCRELGIGTIVVACDAAPPLDQAALERIQVSLTQIAQECGSRGLRAALEFQASAAFGNNLQTAVSLAAETGSPHLGICFDAFHWYCGPSKLEDLGYLSPANLFHVQLCDLLGTPREFATDGDRILPGEGDLPIAAIIERLQAIGYAGPVSIETSHPVLRQVSPRQFGEIAMTALRKLLGQAAMSSHSDA